MCRPRGKVFAPTGIDLANFDLHSAMAYEATTFVYQRVRRFNSSWISKKVEMDLEIFLLRF